MLSQQSFDRHSSFQDALQYHAGHENYSFDQQLDATAQKTTEKAIAPLTFDDAVSAGFRIGYREDATAIAQKTLDAGALATQTILQMAGWIQQMKSRLNRKEFSAFVKDLLQWVGEEARKYLDIARAFEGFDLTRLVNLEPFTLLKLRSKRYLPVVERLREESDITPKLIHDLIRELLAKQSRKKPDEALSGWKRNNSGGGRHYEVLLHDETTGLSIEQQAQAEGILPQKVIAEAVALRAKHKESSGTQVTEPIANTYSVTGDFQGYAQTEEVEELARPEIALIEEQPVNEAIAIAIPETCESVDEVAMPEREVDQHLEQQGAAIAVPPQAILAGENRSEVEWVLNAPIDELEALISSVPVRSAYRALYLLNQFHSDDAKRMQLLEQRVTEYHISIGAVKPTAALPPEQMTEHELETTEATDYDQQKQAPQDLEQGLSGDAALCACSSERSVEKEPDAHNLGSGQNNVLNSGDLVEINVVRSNGDKTWNGMRGYIQELKPSTGKAVVLLQGDYRGKQFFSNELKLVQPVEAENSNKDALAVSGCVEKCLPAQEELEAQPEPQVFHVGDKVEIVSARHGDDLVWQVGIVKVANSAVGCVVEVAGQVHWFCVDEIVLVSAATPPLPEQDKNATAFQQPSGKLNYNPYPQGRRGAAANWEVLQKNGGLKTTKRVDRMDKWREIERQQKEAASSSTAIVANDGRDF